MWNPVKYSEIIRQCIADYSESFFGREKSHEWVKREGRYLIEFLYLSAPELFFAIISHEVECFGSYRYLTYYTVDAGGQKKSHS